MGTLRITILGCGSSGGVPRIDGDWGVCDPNEPKNRRTRCGLLVQRWRGASGADADATTVLIDTAPELRDQLIAAQVKHVDGIVFTHAHADQTHGIDDVRAFALLQRKRLPVWMDAPTRDALIKRFGYCFHGAGAYRPILEDVGDIRVGESFDVAGPGGAISFLPMLQEHGPIMSLGFRFGACAYSNDVSELPPASFAPLAALDLWIVDALRYTPHPTHAHLERALGWVERLRPARTILTNMHVDLDYQTLKRELPAGVEPAFDGMAIELED
ncbi:MAG: MBL fold metallo-hydrolase [Hyphomonadaceae bacterium]